MLRGLLFSTRKVILVVEMKIAFYVLFSTFHLSLSLLAGPCSKPNVRWMNLHLWWWWNKNLGNIWEHTVEKSQTNANSVIMHHIKQAIWGLIWKHIAGKSQTNATSVVMHFLKQAIWGNVWKYTTDKGRSSATSVIMHPLGQAIWGHIWKHIAEKSQTSATSVSMHPLR